MHPWAISTEEVMTQHLSRLLLLTPWCSVLLEKLTGLQLVKKFPFYGTRRFITALTSVRHLSLPWASPIQSTYPHPTSWRSILILSTHLRLDLPSGLFPSSFPTKTLYAPLSSPHTRHMPSPSHSSRFHHPHNIMWAVQIIKLFIMKFSSSSFYLVPLKPKYSPQHPILKHPQSRFLPQYQRPSFTPIQNNRQLFFFTNATTCSYELSWFPSWLWR